MFCELAKQAVIVTRETRGRRRRTYEVGDVGENAAEHDAEVENVGSTREKPTTSK